MLVFLHVTIALVSLLQASITAVMPSKRLLRFSYSLIAATLASGTYLVVHLNSPLVSACASGLAYLAGVTALLVIAQHRLAHR